VWYELANLEQVEAERLDLGQDAVKGRPVQEALEHGFGALQPRRHRRERRQHGGAEVPLDPDYVQGGRWVHDAMVEGWQVKPHHRDQVTWDPGSAVAPEAIAGVIAFLVGDAAAAVSGAILPAYGA
jgi:hypothetical protein